MKKKITIQHLKIALVALIIIRFFFDLCGEWIPGDFVPHSFALPQSKSWTVNLIPDDLEISRTAYFLLQSDHFITDVSFDRPKFRNEKVWPSAFRNRYNVLYDALLIKAYEYFYGPITLNLHNNLPDKYFTFYSLVLFFLKWLLMLIAIVPLYKCARLFLNELLTILFLMAWELYPSNWYIFPINCFDNVAISITTIIISLLILLAVEKKYNNKQIAFLGLLCCLGFSIKFHIVSITFAMCIFAIIFGLVKRNLIWIYSFTVILLLHLIIIIPLLWSTQKTLGHSVISTQSGINLFHGHNPVARGSWSPKIWGEYPDILNPILIKEKDRLSADEYVETETYKKMAIQWAVNHPLKELILSIKKVIIYFIPYNFLSWQLNPMTLLIHMGFIVLTLFMLIHPSRYTLEYWLLIVSAWSMVAFNVLYFVEYRWRYFVEPEMVLATFILFNILINKKQTKQPN